MLESCEAYKNCGDLLLRTLPVCNMQVEFRKVTFTLRDNIRHRIAPERPQITGRTSLTMVVTDAIVPTNHCWPTRPPRTKKHNRSECYVSGEGHTDGWSLIVGRIVGSGVVRRPFVGFVETRLLTSRRRRVVIRPMTDRRIAASVFVVIAR